MSKKALPTLADEVVRATFESPDLLTAEVRRQMHQAREAPGPALQAGRSKHWVKVKNRSHPAMSRVMESFS
jgi:hypothetical protein